MSWIMLTDFLMLNHFCISEINYSTWSWCHTARFSLLMFYLEFLCVYFVHTLSSFEVLLPYGRLCKMNLGSFHLFLWSEDWCQSLNCLLPIHDEISREMKRVQKPLYKFDIIMTPKQWSVYSSMNNAFSFCNYFCPYAKFVVIVFNKM